MVSPVLDRESSVGDTADAVPAFLFVLHRNVVCTTRWSNPIHPSNPTYSTTVLHLSGMLQHYFFAVDCSLACCSVSWESSHCLDRSLCSSIVSEQHRHSSKKPHSLDSRILSPQFLAALAALYCAIHCALLVHWLCFACALLVLCLCFEGGFVLFFCSNNWTLCFLSSPLSSTDYSCVSVFLCVFISFVFLLYFMWWDFVGHFSLFTTDRGLLRLLSSSFPSASWCFCFVFELVLSSLISFQGVNDYGYFSHILVLLGVLYVFLFLLCFISALSWRIAWHCSGLAGIFLCLFIYQIESCPVLLYSVFLYCWDTWIWYIHILWICPALNDQPRCI